MRSTTSVPPSSRRWNTTVPPSLTPTSPARGRGRSRGRVASLRPSRGRSPALSRRWKSVVCNGNPTQSSAVCESVTVICPFESGVASAAFPSNSLTASRMTVGRCGVTPSGRSFLILVSATNSSARRSRGQRVRLPPWWLASVVVFKHLSNCRVFRSCRSTYPESLQCARSISTALPNQAECTALVYQQAVNPYWLRYCPAETENSLFNAKLRRILLVPPPTYLLCWQTYQHS